jgi:hypothetical protein
MRQHQGALVTPSRRIRSIAQLEREWDIFKSEISSRKSFPDNSEEAKKARREQGRVDILFFAKTYFPEYFSEDWASFHKKWPNIAEICEEPVLVAAMRGAGKSTFFAFLKHIHSIVYGNIRYLVLGAYDYDRACLATARILLELLYNPRLASDFDPFFTDDKKPGAGFFVASCPMDKDVSIAIQAISIGQNARGLVWGPYRPDSVTLDDIQMDKRARSKKWVSETLDWIFRQLIPAMTPHYRLQILATFLNTKCVASMLKNGGKISGKEYKAIRTYEYYAQEGQRDDGKPTWPAVFPLKRLNSLRETLGSLIYRQEYLLIPSSEDGSIFPDEWIKSYVPDDLKDKPIDATLTYIDPASKDQKKNCKKAVITGSIAGGIIYIRAAWIRNSSILKMISAAYSHYDQYRSYSVIYEDNGGHALLGPLFDAEAKDKGYSLPYRGRTEDENKIQRIEQNLSADIENGRIRFLKDDPDQIVLIEELVDFPNGDLDGPDCLAGLVRSLKDYMRSGGFTVRGGHRREAYEISRGYS